MRVSDPNLYKQYGREARIFDAVVWEHERENIVLVGSYANFTQTPAMRQHLLGTGDRHIERSLYDTIWVIGDRADHRNALCPPAWRGLSLMLWYGLGRPVVTSEIGNWSVLEILRWRFVFGIIMKREARAHIVRCHHDSSK